MERLQRVIQITFPTQLGSDAVARQLRRWDEKECGQTEAQQQSEQSRAQDVPSMRIAVRPGEEENSYNGER